MPHHSEVSISMLAYLETKIEIKSQHVTMNKRYGKYSVFVDRENLKVMNYGTDGNNRWKQELLVKTFSKYLDSRS